MNEHELRALVRDAVARHLGPRAAGPASESLRPAFHASSPLSQVGPSGPPHASHGVYISLVNVGDACLIEPSVECTHCEYCRSHGH